MEPYILNDKFEKLYPDQDNLNNAISLIDIFNFLIKTEKLSNIFKSDIVKLSKHIKYILEENNIILNVFIPCKKSDRKILTYTSKDEDNILLVKGYYEGACFSI